MEIVLPTPLLMEVLKWYHIMLGHCGTQRLYDTVRERFHADGLHKQYIATVRHCPNEYQREKDNERKYDKLPPREELQREIEDQIELGGSVLDEQDRYLLGVAACFRWTTGQKDWL